MPPIALLGLILLGCTRPAGAPVAASGLTPPTAEAAEAAEAAAPAHARRALVDALVLPRPARNVLMVSVDTLRRDALSRYGTLASTPFLDGLLAGGLALDDHRSCSNWTLPATLCVYAGRDPTTVGWFPEGTLGVAGPLPAGTPLLARWLADRGFATGLVSANPLFGRKSNFAGDFGEAETGAWDAAGVVERGLALVDRLDRAGKPWFVHLHFIDPHSPYRPPAGYEPPATPGALALPLQAVKRQYDGLDAAARAATLDHLRAQYAGDVRYTDDRLRDLFAALDAAGRLESTLVVLWSDHGDQLQEHGAWEHGEDLHDEETAVLGGFWMKGMRPVAWTGPTSHVDLVPTLLTALGLSAPVPLTGVSVGRRPEDAPRFAEVLKGQYTLQSVDAAGWRLVYGWDGSMRLYHRAEDPGDLHDLYTPDHPEGRRLWSLLEPQVRRLAALETRVTPVPPGGPRPADMGPAPWSGGGDPATQANTAEGAPGGREARRGGGPRGGGAVPDLAAFAGSRAWTAGTWRGTAVWVADAGDPSWVAVRTDVVAGASYWLVRREMVSLGSETRTLPAGTAQAGLPAGAPVGGGRGGRGR